jgi:hypothetical protein
MDWSSLRAATVQAMEKVLRTERVLTERARTGNEEVGMSGLEALESTGPAPDARGLNIAL